MASNRSGIGADKSGDENNKTFDDNAPPQQELMRAALDELLQTVRTLKHFSLIAYFDKSYLSYCNKGFNQGK